MNGCLLWNGGEKLDARCRAMDWKAHQLCSPEAVKGSAELIRTEIFFWHTTRLRRGGGVKGETLYSLLSGIPGCITWTFSCIHGGEGETEVYIVRIDASLWQLESIEKIGCPFSSLQDAFIWRQKGGTGGEWEGKLGEEGKIGRKAAKVTAKESQDKENEEEGDGKLD